MLIARAPMRISFAGGGTDLPVYYRKHGGMVVSASIDKYVYVFVSPNAGGGLQLSSSDYSTFVRHSGLEEIAESGKLSYARAFMRRFGIRGGYSVFMASEMPPGTGLGSSSSLAVALTKALATLQDDVPSKARVAEIASEVEIERLGMPIGRQDHYASAHGSLNEICFAAGGITVTPLRPSAPTRQRLEACLMMFFTEQSHDSRELLADQTRRSADPNSDTVEALHEIKGHAAEVKAALATDEPDRLGEIMHRSWLAKKRLAQGITNPSVDAAYEAALAAGAAGGKIAGAGGGGFLLLYCIPSRQAPVTAALEKLGLTRSDFHFEESGARVLVNNASQ